jgi:hypothetical protein
MMWKAGTVARANRVDAAFIVFEVQELAGLLAIDPVAIAILAQVFLFELIHRHPDMSRNSKQILFIVCRRHGFATVGTRKAIHLLPHLQVGSNGHRIESTRRVNRQPRQKSFHRRLIFSHPFSKQPEINFFHERKVKVKT